MIERECSRIIAKGHKILEEADINYQWIKDRKSL